MESEEQDVEIQVTDEAVNTNTASENQEMSDVLIVTEFYNAESESASEKRKLVRLPLARVKQMMKTDMECALISQDAVFLVTKATVSFTHRLRLKSRSSEAYTLAVCFLSQ